MRSDNFPTFKTIRRQSRPDESVTLIKASDVKPEPTSWLWPGWIAGGKLQILAGAPGTGKTTLAMTIAAIVSNGGDWPDGGKSISGNVVIWSGEDDHADTLTPRLILAGADMSRVYFVSDILDGVDKRAFDPSKDMPILLEKMAEIGDVRLLIVDPIVSAVSGDSHKNAEVRRSLQPLVTLAAELKCALLGITHFSKGTSGQDPVERLTGSLAFGALPRVVMTVTNCKNPEIGSANTRLLCRVKSNIGPDGNGHLYGLHECGLLETQGVVASTVVWGEHLIGSVHELLKMAASEKTDDDDSADGRRNPSEFLSNLLMQGPLKASEITRLSAEEGFSYQAISRASTKLGVLKKKGGMHEGWIWSLPSKTSTN